MGALQPFIMGKKLSQDELDHGAEVYWKGEVDKALHELDQRQKAVNKDAYDTMQRQKSEGEGALGPLVCEMDGREWLWLKEQYGDEAVRDPQFLADYKRLRDQQFLPNLSKRWV